MVIRCILKMTMTTNTEPKTDPQEWLDGKQAGRHIGVSESRWQRIKHLFPASRLTGKPRYSRSMLDEVMKGAIAE
ncbi:MAG: hypothetical protein ACI9R3_005357 [Verrucomicrobiales bacterium]|jgi:hypothetical protein